MEPFLRILSVSSPSAPLEGSTWEISFETWPPLEETGQEKHQLPSFPRCQEAQKYSENNSKLYG